MKNFLLTILTLFMAVPAMAADAGHSHADSWLKPVETKYVCMMNNQAFDAPQMAIEIEGKTYYGCCPMCKDILGKDASKRSATDPVSGQSVDKAAAIIGADPDGNVYYFESDENFHKYASGPMPEAKHEDMDHSHMKGMEH